MVQYGLGKTAHLDSLSSKLCKFTAAEEVAAQDAKEDSHDRVYSSSRRFLLLTLEERGCEHLDRVHPQLLVDQGIAL